MPKKNPRTESEPKTLQEAILYFSDPDRALAYVVARRWPNGVSCPTCGSEAVLFLKNQRRWKCGNDHVRRQFSVKVGTVMEDSPLGLDKWLPAIWMVVNCKNGVSSYELARDLDITQKSAWFLNHRIRLGLQQGSMFTIGGEGKTVEVDETFIGAKARAMNAKARRKAAKGGSGVTGPYKYTGSTVVMGMLERGGRVIAKTLEGRRNRFMFPHIETHVEPKTEMHTDAFQGYTLLPEIEHKEFAHKVIDHATAYVDGNVHTNGIENFWSLLKRGIRGTYVSVEPFHLHRYLDEQMFRFNMREGTDKWRFVAALGLMFGKRLTYNELIGADMEELSPA